MATRRQKKEEAKRLIREESIPDFPVPRTAPAPVRIPNLIVRGAKALGEGLVELDPLNILTDDAVVAAMVNEPSVQLTPEFVALVNDNSRMVAPTSNGLVEVATPSGQFRRDRLLPRNSNGRRSRKKTKSDKNMSMALREANLRLRTSKGKLRKGKTQADIMRLAHRLRKKM